MYIPDGTYSLTAAQLQQAFGPPAQKRGAPPADKMTGLACDGDGRLVAVSTCWARTADGRVGAGARLFPVKQFSPW
jgi:hypothetical protein